MSASDEAPPARGRVRAGIKVAVVVGLALGLVAAVSSADLAPDLSHLDVVVFSGAPEGNYHAVVEAMAREAASRGGRIENVSTAGSLDNVRRLEGEPQDPRGRFALVQAGSDWKPDTGLRLIARLPASDTVFFLGRDADRLTRLAQLAGLRVGIGPEGSGTARVARHLFERPELAPLGVETSHHTLEAQLDLLERGELDPDEAAKRLQSLQRKGT